jgi:tetratricopeptide (TPR) repeat protein
MLLKSLSLQQLIAFAFQHFHGQVVAESKRGSLPLPSLVACAVSAFAAVACANAVAQSPDISSLEAYVDAIKQPNTADQVNSMERFLQISGQSTLRLDALEVLVMDYQKMNNSERAVARAHDLLNIDPSNPLAIAVLNENGVPTNNRKGRNDDYNAARRGLSNVDMMHKPEGMGQAQFTQLQQKIRGMLAGAIGMGYLEQQDYEKATNYLQQAVAAEPQSARYSYGLAQAILSGSNGNNADAYWLLAKAVNLAKGTPNEQQIASDSLRKYRENGGSEAVWNQLLAAAAASNAQSNAAPTATNTQPAQSQTATPASNPAPGNNPPASSLASPASTVNPSAVTPNNGRAGTPVPSSAAATNTTATPNTAPSPTSPTSAVNSGSNSSQATVADREVARPAPPAAQPSQTQAPVTQTPATQAPVTQVPDTRAPATQAPVTQTPVNNDSPAATSPGQPQGSATPPAPQAKTNVPPYGNSGSVTWEYVTPGSQNSTAAKPATNQTVPAAAPSNTSSNSSHATTTAANPPAAANRSNNIGAPQNPAQKNTTTVATASPPAVRGNASNLPESDQPSLVVRPPASSSTPAGPTSAPLADRKPAVSPPPVVTNPIITAPTGPVSLGILIQTELLSGNYREPIMEAMREMARNLRPGDEAFIMAFSDQLDFEQDLTENDELLEEGLRNLQPKAGAALFEGMTFAVQHLKRIGKNGNRVLLIISDGRNVPSTNGQQHLDADVSRVRIDCIGLDVEQALDRQNLQKLAYWSGGMTSFVNDPEQIRTAASAIARTIVGEGFANR